MAALLGMPLAGGALAADRVKTANGVVEGTGPQDSGVRMFKGIPFAEPPVGDLRWKPPQPVKNWTGRSARRHSSARGACSSRSSAT